MRHRNIVVAGHAESFCLSFSIFQNFVFGLFFKSYIFTHNFFEAVGKFCQGK